MGNGRDTFMTDIWDWPSYTWVHRRKQAEDHLKQNSELLWRDVKAAIEDACRAFNELYGKELNQAYSSTTSNDHRIRVNSQAKDQMVDIDFNREDLTIKASYHSRSFLSPKSYRITADAKSAFLIGENDRQLTPDEVSQGILEPMFFASGGSIYRERGVLTL